MENNINVKFNHMEGIDVRSTTIEKLKNDINYAVESGCCYEYIVYLNDKLSEIQAGNDVEINDYYVFQIEAPEDIKEIKLDIYEAYLDGFYVFFKGKCLESKFEGNSINERLSDTFFQNESVAIKETCQSFKEVWKFCGIDKPIILTKKIFNEGLKNERVNFIVCESEEILLNDFYLRYKSILKKVSR